MTLPITDTQAEWPEGARLLLGLGAQKAGTTWVHALLSGHPDCVAGPIKEKHYFDSVFGLTGGLRKLRAKQLDQLVAAGKGDGPRARNLRELDAVIASPEPDHHGYLRFMARKLGAGQVALDITPSYGRLDDDAFAQMAAIPQARFLFLMRDPVARLWSSFRMDVAKRTEGAEFEAICQDGLDAAFDMDDEVFIQRANYVETLERLERHVPEERRLVLFFEHLFTQESVDRLHDFLGVARRPMGVAPAENVGQAARMRTDQVSRLTKIFRGQYDAICDRFGDAVPSAWHRRFDATGVLA